jgi:hypothetical protein
MSGNPLENYLADGAFGADKADARIFPAFSTNGGFC